MDALFAGLDRLRPAAVSYGKGETIFEEGDCARLACMIHNGWVRPQVTGADGVRKIVAFVGPAEIFGACTGINHVTAEAVTPVSLYAYDVASLSKLSGEAPELALQLLAETERRYAVLTQHLVRLLQWPAPQRVLWFLADIAARVSEEPNGLVRLPMSREDISDFLGIAPATLSRVLTRLQDEGRLLLSGPRNFALRPPASRAAAREENRARPNMPL